MYLAHAVTPRNHSGCDVKFIDISNDFEEITNKLKKLNRLLASGIMDDNVTMYLLGMDRLRYQAMIYFFKTVRQLVDTTYKNFS